MLEVEEDVGVCCGRGTVTMVGVRISGSGVVLDGRLAYELLSIFDGIVVGSGTGVTVGETVGGQGMGAIGVSVGSGKVV